ncbi:hypothetical protein ACFYOT_39530 [Saccharothrix saharensis]|uniref:hypothetical protein n=1 Tax=Saccharothrix saharensis TaxID=571190 RepID=UPI003679D1B6
MSAARYSSGETVRLRAGFSSTPNTTVISPAPALLLGFTVPPAPGVMLHSYTSRGWISTSALRSSTTAVSARQESCSASGSAGCVRLEPWRGRSRHRSASGPT